MFIGAGVGAGSRLELVVDPTADFGQVVLVRAERVLFALFVQETKGFGHLQAEIVHPEPPFANAWETSTNRRLPRVPAALVAKPDRLAQAP